MASTTPRRIAPTAPRMTGFGTRSSSPGAPAPSGAPQERQTASPGFPGEPHVAQMTEAVDSPSFNTSYSMEGGTVSRESPSGTSGTFRTTLQVLQRSFLPESSGPTL